MLDPLELSFADIGRLSDLLQRGQTTSVALTVHVLDRLERRGRHWNAVVTLDSDGALAAAEAADHVRDGGGPVGPLHGIPFAVKDILATRPPLPTTWGASPFATRQFDYEAGAITRLSQAGAVLVGKLAMIELGGMLPFETFDACLTGACRNPFDPEAWTGDSSTGSAAAVGGGLVPFALAGETRGSIIQPAAFCGAVGLRPSAGLVPLEGAMPVSPTVDRLGPIARSPDDCLTILGALARQPFDPPLPRRWRIGVIHPDPSFDAPDVRANFAAMLEHLAAIADLPAVTVPDWPFDAVFREIVHHEAKQNFAPLIGDGTVDRLASPLARGGGYLAEPPDHAAYAGALEARTKLTIDWCAWSDGLDAIVTTTNPKVAPPLDTTFTAYFENDDHEPITTIGAVLGLPAITIPSGLGNRSLPTGLQMVGRPGDDAIICAIAQALWRMSPQPRPPAAHVA